MQRTYDMSANLRLHSILLEDCIQKLGDDFKYLATSEMIETDDSTDLIKINYEAINKVNQGNFLEFFLFFL